MMFQSGVISKFKIPVRISGSAKGLKNKGVLLCSKKRIAVKGAPEKLPNSYDLDVSELDVGDAILVRNLPEIDGVKIIENQDVAIVGVIKAK